jgi:PKHD-type hydroxylase
MKKTKKEIKFENSCWNFYLDQINNYAFWNNAFSIEECNTIIDIGKSKGLIQGKTNGERKQKIRKSEISWLFPCDDMDWVFRRCTDIIMELNNSYFKFDLHGFNEGFQFTNYVAPGGKYGKHIDKTFNGIIRKLSMSLQLSNPSEYEGGELHLYDTDEGTLMDKSQGTLIVFPSYTLHEVSPVTKGERNSLVGWVTGNQFK